MEGDGFCMYTMVLLVGVFDRDVCAAWSGSGELVRARDRKDIP